MLGNGSSSSSRPPPRTDKPAPPLPAQALRPNDRYDSRPHESSYGGSRLPDPRYGDHGGGGGGSVGHSPRYDSRLQDPRQEPRFSEYGSPPPQNYGFGRGGPPPSQSHGRPPVVNRPPPTPAPPKDANDRDALWPLFKAVDKDGMLRMEALKLYSSLSARLTME